MYGASIEKIATGFWKDNFWSKAETLMKLQWYPRQQLEDMQFRKLKHMINHAYENVHFYREKFRRQGITPGDIKNREDIVKLPITMKEELRSNFPDKVLARNIQLRNCKLMHTAGTTCRPLSLYVNKEAIYEDYASFLFFNSWFHYRFGDKWMRVGNPKGKTLQMKIMHLLQRRHDLPIFELSVDVRSIVQKMNKYKPFYLQGFPSSLSPFALQIRDQGLRIEFKLNAIVTTSETLLEFYRTTLESVFGCRVFDRYGLNETGKALAQECEYHSGLHVNSQLALVEIVDDEGQKCSVGEKGRIVSTNLHNFAMPFIRYETGDIGIEGDGCNCGRSLPLLQKIEGRIIELFETESGEKISVASYDQCMFSKFFQCMLQFQFAQRKRGELILRIVPSRDCTEEMKEQMIKELQQIRSGVVVRLETYEEIPADESGKRPLFRHL